MIDKKVVVKAPRCRDDSLKNHKTLIGDKIVEWINGIGKMSEMTWKELKSIPGYVFLYVGDTDKIDEGLKICRYINAHKEISESRVFEMFQIKKDSDREQVRNWREIILGSEEPTEPAKDEIPEREPEEKGELKNKGNIGNNIKHEKQGNNKGTPITTEAKIPLKRIEGELSRKTLHLSIALIKRSRDIAAERGISLSQFVNCAINELLNRLREEN
ncbi:MAG: hypothetical protein KAW56_17730 [Candidatus Marinimicrobia bacterium]|nr:hypothetical protein [Candidatus Neomarinimicrobiota bacterium]